MNSKYLYKTLAASSLLLIVTNVSAEEARIYQQDSTGNIQYHKPSAIIQNDGRIIKADSLGNKQYHKQQYHIKYGKVYQIDSVGNVQYHKTYGVIK